MMNLKNHDQVVEQLAEMMLQLDKEMNPYQTDVYIYYDEGSNTAELDTFANVGGNSWLNDDHKVLYRDAQHYDTIYDYFQDVDDLAYSLDMTVEQLTEEATEANEWIDDIEDCDFSDIRDYIESRTDYSDKIKKAYEQALEDGRDYDQEAEYWVAEFEKSLES